MNEFSSRSSNIKRFHEPLHEGFFLICSSPAFSCGPTFLCVSFLCLTQPHIYLAIASKCRFYGAASYSSAQHVYTLLWYNGGRPHYALGQVSPFRYMMASLPPEECQMWWTHTNPCALKRCVLPFSGMLGNTTSHDSAQYEMRGCEAMGIVK